MPTLTLDVPPDVFSALRCSPEEFVEAMRLAAAMHWYGSGVVSQEKAAHIAGLDRTSFLDALAKERRDVFIVDMRDLKKEFQRA